MKKDIKSIFLCLAALFLIVCFGILIFAGVVVAYTKMDNRKEEYLKSIETTKNSTHFFYLSTDSFEFVLNNTLVQYPNIDTPCSYFDCVFFGAKDNELFYYVNSKNGVEFYKSNYTNYTYEMTRSFNNEEILYHKCDKLIYLGEDGKTYIFDGFDLTDEVYESEIPTYTPRYTVTAEKKDFIIKNNETGAEKRISDLKKTFRQNDHVKKIGLFSKIVEVFVHEDDIYVLYESSFRVVVFKMDFDKETLEFESWCNIVYGDGKTWYLDRVKFTE